MRHRRKKLKARGYAVTENNILDILHTLIIKITLVYTIIKCTELLLIKLSIPSVLIDAFSDEVSKASGLHFEHSDIFDLLQS